MSSSWSQPVRVLIKDLLLASRVTTVARAQELTLKVLREPASLSAEQGTLLIVDLNLAGAIEAAAVWKQEASEREVIGFVSHVDADAARRAHQAGLQVFSRSAFFEKLPALLAGGR